MYLQLAKPPLCFTPRSKPIIETDMYSTLHNKEELPIYTTADKMLSTQECMGVLLNSKLDMKRVGTKVPFAINVNSVFVIGLNKLNSTKDVFCDDMGVWKWGGSYRKWCLVGEDETLESKSPTRMCYRIWKHYYALQSNPDIRRMIVMLEGIFYHCAFME